MLKNIALALGTALAIGTLGLASSAEAGYGYKSHGYKSYGYKSYGYKSYGHKRHYGYRRHYKPIYTYRHYKPVCHSYGWVWKHGYKVRTCLY